MIGWARLLDDRALRFSRGSLATRSWHVGEALRSEGVRCGRMIDMLVFIEDKARFVAFLLGTTSSTLHVQLDTSHEQNTDENSNASHRATHGFSC
jgi:hypothetical protein